MATAIPVTMGDIRFTMIGVALVFAGFITLGVFGGEYQSGSIEAEEFDTCYRYSDDAEPVKVSCAAKIGCVLWSCNITNSRWRRVADKGCKGQLGQQGRAWRKGRAGQERHARR